MTYWKVRIFWSMIHYSAICPYLCAERDQCIRLDRILYTIENDMTCYHLWCNMSASATRWDRILYKYIHVTTPLLHIDMLIHCSTLWTIYPFYPDSSSICDELVWCFSQSSMCASTFSQHIINDFWLNYYSTFLFSSDLNLTSTFIFALIISYWLNVRPWLQRHFTFDMLLHI